eukprot:EG_transcript_12224
MARPLLILLLLLSLGRTGSGTPDRSGPATILHLGPYTYANRSTVDSRHFHTARRRCFDGPAYRDGANFTATRPYPAPASLQAAIVLLVTTNDKQDNPHYRLSRLLSSSFTKMDKISSEKKVNRTRWSTWQEYLFHPFPQLVLVVVFQAHPAFDAAHVARLLDLHPADCSATLQAAAGCALLRSLDSGYIAYQGRTLPGPAGRPFFVLIGTTRVDPPPSVARRNLTKVLGRWPLGYVSANTWYVHQMFDLQLLHFFDFFIKLDDDVRFFQPLPATFFAEIVGPTQSLFFHTGPYLEPPHIVKGLVGFIETYFDLESDRCARQVHPACMGKPWFEQKRKTYWGNFNGGWLGFFTSPEVRMFSWLWLHYPDGRWAHRWTDQKYWKQALGAFHNGSRVARLSHLRGPVFYHPGKPR